MKVNVKCSQRDFKNVCVYVRVFGGQCSKQELTLLYTYTCCNDLSFGALSVKKNPIQNQSWKISKSVDLRDFSRLFLSTRFAPAVEILLYFYSLFYYHKTVPGTTHCKGFCADNSRPAWIVQYMAHKMKQVFRALTRL